MAISNLFLENKYTKWYSDLVAVAKERNWSKQSAPCYTESHHVIPRSLGGDNSKDNLVRITAREHFLMHLLLTKMCVGKDKHKMISGAHMMTFSKTSTQERNFTSRQFETVRKLFSEHQKVNSLFARDNPKWMTGKTHSEETRAKIKAARAHQVTTDETRQKMSENYKTLIWMYDSVTLKNTRVHKEFVDTKLTEGFILGRYGFITEDIKQKLSAAAKEQWKKQKVKS